MPRGKELDLVTSEVPSTFVIPIIVHANINTDNMIFFILIVIVWKKNNLEFKTPIIEYCLYVNYQIYPQRAISVN